MLSNSHGTNFFDIKFLARNNIKRQNEPVLSSAQVFYFNGQALSNNIELTPRHLRLVWEFWFEMALWAILPYLIVIISCYSCSVNWHEQSMNTLTYIMFLFAMGQIVPLGVITFSYVNIIRTLKKVSLKISVLCLVCIASTWTFETN
jgi:hypothetical protein